ncbi:NAD(+) synthase [Methanosarcina sp. UBA5]|uniref:NAD(+) synthase n=1 Tax=Methanosarcina sp. UBA5 TaxID=1915593 RepID=UPI0025FCE99A|nr:NAD(+) synthase [Methanosarcina sp. UBA5]
MTKVENEKLGFPEYLEFDAEKTRKEIVEFVRNNVKKFGKDGVMVGLSGGLDSSTVAYLCVEALGKDKVYGLILPDRDTNPQNTDDGMNLAKSLGIPHEKIVISPFLEELGAYNIISQEKASDRTVLEQIAARNPIITERELPSTEHFSPTATVGASSLSVKDFLAVGGAKTHVRMTVFYFHATLKNYLVVGTDDRSELSLGVYDRYGDGACDISILSHLYKTQIKQLAKHIGVPDHIVNKTSSADLFGMSMPNESLIGLSYLKLDDILCGIRKSGLNDEDIASMAGVKPSIVQSVRKGLKDAAFVASLPVSLPLL